MLSAKGKPASGMLLKRSSRPLADEDVRERTARQVSGIHRVVVILRRGFVAPKDLCNLRRTA
jgi:hypothetical protein